VCLPGSTESRLSLRRRRRRRRRRPPRTHALAHAQGDRRHVSADRRAFKFTKPVPFTWTTNADDRRRSVCTSCRNYPIYEGRGRGGGGRRGGGGEKNGRGVADGTSVNRPDVSAGMETGEWNFSSNSRGNSLSRHLETSRTSDSSYASD